MINALKVLKHVETYMNQEKLEILAFYQLSLL